MAGLFGWQNGIETASDFRYREALEPEVGQNRNARFPEIDRTGNFRNAARRGRWSLVSGRFALSAHLA